MKQRNWSAVVGVLVLVLLSSCGPKAFTKGEYDDDELAMITNFVNSVDNEILNDYNNTCTILSYDNDLQLFIEVLDSLITICENREDYEVCELLKNKKDDALEIISTKTI